MANSAVKIHKRGEKTDQAEDSFVTVRNLLKQYGDEGVEAIKGINFDLERGTAVGILGPNGAGKTTTIKCILGLIVPTEGTVRIGDIDVLEDPKTAYQHIGGTFEGARNMYWRLTVEENLDFFAALAGNNPRERQARHEELLEQFDISDKADTVVRELSRGQKQKVTLACALARNADFLFLDEPTLGLDIESKLELQDVLKKLVERENTTVLVSSHDMDVIEEVCDRAIIMNDGEIIADDTVDNLVHLFEKTRYEITVDGECSDIRTDLEGKFDADGFKPHGSKGMQFRVTVASNEFYDLIDLLRNADLSIETIETVDTNLEEVFLSLTENSDDRRSATETDQSIASSGRRSHE
ncbi:ABC transporter [Natrinema saccharevitans]|uniref:ABC transporter n=1 Tax=Natrinema saccharevitans TaxID=301967 RepID=A0A1S8AW17_9EURY|nr:ABC transporter ATP-binding protein [Natrinema saccharevitans]OLZ40862.1 ABC transporter [Natrinema saccharevitans]